MVRTLKSSTKERRSAEIGYLISKLSCVDGVQNDSISGVVYLIYGQPTPFPGISGRAQDFWLTFSFTFSSMGFGHVFGPSQTPPGPDKGEICSYLAIY